MLGFDFGIEVHVTVLQPAVAPMVEEAHGGSAFSTIALGQIGGVSSSFLS